MCTAILSIGQVRGAELWLAGWALCAIAYFAVLFSMKRTRKKGAAKNTVFWFLAAEVLTDFLWAICYNRPVYLNYGIVAVYGLALWPVCLLVAGWIAARQNQSKSS